MLSNCGGILGLAISSSFWIPGPQVAFLEAEPRKARFPGLSSRSPLTFWTKIGVLIGFERKKDHLFQNPPRTPFIIYISKIGRGHGKKWKQCILSPLLSSFPFPFHSFHKKEYQTQSKLTDCSSKNTEPKGQGEKNK